MNAATSWMREDARRVPELANRVTDPMKTCALWSAGQELTSEYVRSAVGLTTMQATVRWPPSQAF